MDVILFIIVARWNPVRWKPSLLDAYYNFFSSEFDGSCASDLGIVFHYTMLDGNDS